MADELDYQAQVARCREMLQQAVTPETRNYWLRMAEYWQRRYEITSDQVDDGSAGRQGVNVP